MSIGERIKYLRKEVLSATQKDFGSQIGLKPNSVSDIESGKNTPTNQTIRAICREFNIDEDWLRTGEGEMFSDEDIDFGSVCAKIGATDERAKKVIMDYYSLSSQDKELLLNFIEKFLK